MSSLKGRVKKLHGGAISNVNSEIIITLKGEVLRQVKRGTNPNKVIRLAVRL